MSMRDCSAALRRSCRYPSWCVLALMRSLSWSSLSVLLLLSMLLPCRAHEPPQHGQPRVRGSAVAAATSLIPTQQYRSRVQPPSVVPGPTCELLVYMDRGVTAWHLLGCSCRFVRPRATGDDMLCYCRVDVDLERVCRAMSRERGSKEIGFWGGVEVVD